MTFQLIGLGPLNPWFPVPMQGRIVALRPFPKTGHAVGQRNALFRRSLARGTGNFDQIRPKNRFRSNLGLPNEGNKHTESGD
jgi:hypothetical protein